MQEYLGSVRIGGKKITAPLEMQRKCVLDRYFDDIAVEQVEPDEIVCDRIKNGPFLEVIPIRFIYPTAAIMRRSHKQYIQSLIV